jgi:hypothetical protein
MSIQVDSSEFLRAFGDLQAYLHNGAHQALVAAVKAAHDSARTTNLFKDGPDARLRGSIVMGIDTPMTGHVSAGGRAAPYVQYVESGTRAHEIRPKRGKTLRFEIAGEVLFRKVVHHPGTAARPFMARALAVGEQTLDYGLEIMLERPIAAFNAG